MDFQAFVDNIDMMTCVMSVEMKEDGNYGDIRIVAGNAAYVQSIETAWDGPQLMSNKFVPNSKYQNYFPTDLNFETVCYRAAVEKVPIHTYVHPDRFDFWFDLYLIPLMNEGNMYYCTYSQQVSRQADSKKMSNLDQETASAVLNTVIKLSNTANFKETLNAVIKDIREICGAYSCCILGINDQDSMCKVLAEDRENKDEMLTMRSILNQYPHFYDEIVSKWDDTIGGSNCLITKNNSDLLYVKEKHPLWYQTLVDHDVKSIVLFPMRFNNETLGYIWATNFNTENADQIKSAMELTTFFVTSTLANVQLIKKLKIMSSVDMLTGVLNRNEMNERVNRIVSGEDTVNNLGIVFADINGLKRVNDNLGHFAGDQLLKRAAEILKEIFRRCDIFRAGGDEFMIIIPDTNEEELKKLCNKVKSSSLGFGFACFATGSCYMHDSQEIRKAMHTADERMYQDKAKFYEDNPEYKR